LSPANRMAVAMLAHKHGITFASHDDETPAQIEFAVDQGAIIAEFPLTFEAAEAAQRNGLRIVAGAPNVVRGGSQSGNVVVTDLPGRGLLHILPADYAPGRLVGGAFGLPREPVGYALPAAIATVTREPAETVGLDDRGRIAPGLRADLVRVAEIDG